MLPSELARELEKATAELLDAVESDFECIERLIVCRSAVLTRIAATPPAAFSEGDLLHLRTALENGEAALEKLLFRRRDVAAEWQRCNRLSSANPPSPATISLSA